MKFTYFSHTLPLPVHPSPGKCLYKVKELYQLCHTAWHQPRVQVQGTLASTKTASIMCTSSRDAIIYQNCINHAYKFKYCNAIITLPSPDLHSINHVFLPGNLHTLGYLKENAKTCI